MHTDARGHIQTLSFVLLHTHRHRHTHSHSGGSASLHARKPASTKQYGGKADRERVEMIQHHGQN